MDFTIAKFFNQLGQGTIVDTLSFAISYNGGYVTVFLFLGLWSFWKDKINGRKVMAGLIIAMSMHFAISEGFFKEVVPHYLGIKERPYIAHPQEIVPIGKLSTSQTFPSNHMSSVVAVLGVLIYYYRRYWKYAVLFIILMAFSRMHNGMHYPLDVIGGIALGLIYFQVAIYFVEKYFSEINKLIDNGLRILKLDKYFS